MKTDARNIKELLSLGLINLKGRMGLCECWFWLRSQELITSAELIALLKFMKENKPEGKPLIGMWWVPYHYPPRIEWLRNKITLLK